MDEVKVDELYKKIRGELYELMTMYPLERRSEVQRIITALNAARDKMLLG